jgi:hypothetical protein
MFDYELYRKRVLEIMELYRLSKRNVFQEMGLTAVTLDKFLLDQGNIALRNQRKIIEWIKKYERKNDE